MVDVASKSPPYVQDTIVAAATPAGSGGIAVVRVSGHAVTAIAERMLGGLPSPRRAEIATFADADGTAIDRGIALYFPEPGSFTGEPVLELHAHGGPVIVAALIDAAIAFGARWAEPGEFSKRAYLNDKLDLAQAEAIADLIGSGTRQAAQAAYRSLSGAFSAAVAELSQRVTALRLYVEAAIDFPEEDIDFLSTDALGERIDACEQGFSELLAKVHGGRLLRDGYQIVIVGPPNAGKSSLLNLLSGQDAAIVTDVAGTTRDILRERIDLDGVVVELIDTAGLREDPDAIEAEGIRRAMRAMAEADAALIVRVAGEKDSGGASDLQELPADLPRIVVYNKIDVSGDKAAHVPGRGVWMSATTGEGVDLLLAEIRTLAGVNDVCEGAFSARQRHIDAIKRARGHFDAGREVLTAARAGELFAEELKGAQNALGEITGEVSSDDLLGLIFGEFCIGK